MTNTERLADNVGCFRAGRRGVLRGGTALLQGLVVCGQCGRRMGLHYSGSASNFAVYRCRADRGLADHPRCQEVRAPRVDAAVERLMLEALAPDRIAVALAAIDALGTDTQMLERQWALKRERAAFETERARRQYDTVEPENRLVARSLESIWEEKLRSAERIEQDYECWKAEQVGVLDDIGRARITALGADLPALWQKATMADRKALLRLVIGEVVLDQSRVAGRTWMRILWQTGAHSEHTVIRNTAAYAHHAEVDRIEARIRALNAEGRMDAEIAEV